MILQTLSFYCADRSSSSELPNSDSHRTKWGIQMAKDAALLTEVHKLITQRMDAGKIVQPGEIVETLFENRPLSGEHASFYQAFAKKELLKMVTRIIRNVGLSDDPAPLQLAFPGHTRLVKSYPVLRSGERALVPIGLCSREELSSHITLLRKQASGCENHAAELEDYLQSKKKADDETELVQSAAPNADLAPV